MADEATWLPDLAALASLSVAVHYVLGLYGLLGALLIFILLEHGSTLTEQLKRPKTGNDGSASTLVDDTSTEADDDEVPRENLQPPQDEDDEHEGVQRRVRHGISRLHLRDVGSLHPPCEPLQMNARTPVPFETDLFIGHVLFLVRTTPEDPLYAPLFHGKRRMFWIQVQGRFKQRPRGPIYLGGELPAPIAPGVFTRSVAHVIMGLIRRLVGQVNFSFGKAADELPAVAFPLYQSVDQFIETPVGERPPALGTEDFGETETQRQARKATGLGTETYHVGPTYTFDFHTMYVDLTRWETANLPSGLNAMDLTSFFDALPLRIVAYQVDSSDTEALERHRQQEKAYLFSFEVQYEKERRQVDERTEDEAEPGRNATGFTGGSSEMSTMSTTLSDASSMAEDEPLVAQEHAEFLRLEHARRLGQLSFSYLCWMEEVDVASDVRRVHYVFAVRDKVSAYEDEELDDALSSPPRDRLAIVSSYALRKVLQGRHSIQKAAKGAEELRNLRFHSRSRIGSYSTITSEARQVVQELQKLADESIPSLYAALGPNENDHTTYEERALVGAQAALYTCLTKRIRLQQVCTSSVKLSPSRIGVNLSRRERQDLGVVFEGVVYRYYAADFLRQEVLLLTHDTLGFYRSFASRAEKSVLTSHLLGVRAIDMPSWTTFRNDRLDGAYAFQISTFAEEIVLLVGTKSTRDAWLRGLLQHSNPTTNFERALRGDLYIGFATRPALRPANRVELNSRTLFPHLQPLGPRHVEAIALDSIDGAQKLVKRTLKRALHILNHAEDLSVTNVLAFLDDASGLRRVNVHQLQKDGSHEDQMAFYLNLYHLIVAHAMIVDGFPRTKRQWQEFLMRSCYVVSQGLESEPLTLSLAEIEHVILRARLPRAEVPHLNVTNVLTLAHRSTSRLDDLGLAHPDFRLSMALIVNHCERHDVMIYDAAYVHDQLNAVVRTLLNGKGQLEMIEEAKTIKLPRVCEWYRHDFGSTASACVRKLVGFMDTTLQYQVLEAMGLEDSSLQTTYHSFKYTPKITLTEDTTWSPPVREESRKCVERIQGEQSGGTTQL